MIEIPDEDTVIVDGVVYKAHPEVMGCKHCAFAIVTSACHPAPCFDEGRRDGRYVIFIKELPCVSSQN